ncbi:filamentous hemagglutinin N-terminal domain-containing protein [Bacterioplanes sanyensis]|nr:filamentous hemagglutinin N-terminal domain-containing protein [Bacterioplanes sanyensis]
MLTSSKAFLSIGILSVALPCFSQSLVVPDGSTETGVQMDEFGRTVVSIAPADRDRISHNRYTEFNSASNGLLLDNQQQAARTIINEVTGNNPSEFLGEVRVLGTRAHVIIANPNGISVNGAEFFNTGGLALTTGALGFVEREDSLGRVRRNATALVEQGEIYVGADGLSGIISHLELLSKTIKIEGPITNVSDDDFTNINLVTGASSSEFNSAQSFTDPTLNWRTTSSSDIASTELAVDISSNASFSASRVLMMVTEDGAGVRNYGDIAATASTFSLSTDGKVEFGGSVIAAADVTVEAAELDLRNNDDEQQSIQSVTGQIVLKSSGDSTIEGYLVQASSMADEGAERQETVKLDVAGKLQLESLSADKRTVLFANQNVAVQANEVVNHSSRILANGDVIVNAQSYINNVVVSDTGTNGEVISSERDGRALWYTLYTDNEKIYTRHVDFGEPDAGRLPSEVISTIGNIKFNVESFSNIGGSIISNAGDIDIESDGFSNSALAVGKTWLNSRCNIGGCDRYGGNTMELLGGDIQAAMELRITANDAVNKGGLLQAVGDVTIDTQTFLSQGMPVYDVISRPGGLRTYFLKSMGIWTQVDQGGSLISNMGKITFLGENNRIDGGNIQAAEGLEGEYSIVREPTTQDLIIQREIGVFRKIY